MVLTWKKGKWIQLSYIHRSGSERGVYAYVENSQEFQAVMRKYKISFEDILEFSINGRECKYSQGRDLFLDGTPLVANKVKMYEYTCPNCDVSEITAEVIPYKRCEICGEIMEVIEE
ncbi:hypothetical protein ACQCU1_03305 [Sutcliffiella horikoshii]|uniref:hypothetical protein n=1 Tax=Sutcliffiella horikoshii TaxID=79883 RepID=UPI003CF80D00